jgi:formylglycine-generating enzyme required for sulfatase activity
LANFKPSRGNYVADGGLHTVIVAHYPPNDFGLYDMSGNVAEWTNSAFDEASYNFTWDLNASYTYNANNDDAAVMKRKVTRGGSWKDINYYLQVSTRSYEYQDSAKCYIGFRCVQSYLGRNKDDVPGKSSEIYK